MTLLYFLYAVFYFNKHRRIEQGFDTARWRTNVYTKPESFYWQNNSLPFHWLILCILSKEMLSPAFVAFYKTPGGHITPLVGPAGARRGVLVWHIQTAVCRLAKSRVQLATRVARRRKVVHWSKVVSAVGEVGGRSRVE